ncbi:MAG: CCR4-NOT regulatory complex component [Lichina confinis]|nr:MAG: CCR4-NOT regulatory complex component [Lichina confinis]
MLRLLSGKRLAPAGSITINGLDPFKENLTGITYLGLEWVLNPIVRSDISVPTLLASVGGDAYPARRDELVRILDVDLRWHLHAVSDGERRRVQLVMGLLRPWDILLLDEVTVDLDLLSRRRFLEWLKTETETEAESDTGTVMRRGSSSNGEQAPRRRKPTVVYASHIMDGLSEWPTHLVHMALGRVKQWGTTSTWTEAGALNTQLPANSITNSSSTRANDPSSSVSLANDRTVEENKEQKHQHQHQHQIPNDAVAVPAPTHPSHPPTGKLDLGDLVMHWLTEDLRERGPRNQPSQGKTYGSTHGIGGYGSETKTRKMGGAS